MNPELQRRIWTDLTPGRLGFLLGVLALVFAVAWAISRPGDRVSAVGGVASALFVGLAVLWGGRNAGEAVAGDVRDRTWDLQRMSALSASQMAWGKFAGATLFVWIGAAVCLAAMAFAPATDLLGSAATPEGPGAKLFALWRSAGGAVLAQLAAFVAALLVLRRGVAGVRWSLVVSVGAALAVWSVVSGATSGPAVIAFDPETGALEGWRSVRWYGVTAPGPLFASVLIGLAVAVTALGAVRLLRRDLLERSDGLFLSGALLLTGVILGGLFDDAPLSLPGYAGAWLQIVGVALTAGAWAAAVIEPKDPRRLLRALDLSRAGRLRDAAALAPAFALPALLGLALMAPGAALVALAGPPDRSTDWALLPAVALFVVRDIAVIVGFSAGPRPEKGEFPALVLLGLSYAALGPLADALAQPARALFLPTVSGFGGAAFGLLAAATGATLACMFAVWRLRRRGQGAGLPET